MLLSFSLVNKLFPKNIQGTVLAVINMTIGLSGALFQYLVNFVSTWINNGDIKIIHNSKVFSLSFLILFTPLLISNVLLWQVCDMSSKRE